MWANCLSQSRFWFQYHYERLDEQRRLATELSYRMVDSPVAVGAAPNQYFSYEILCLRCDAGDKNTTEGLKAHACEINSCFRPAGLPTVDALDRAAAAAAAVAGAADAVDDVAADAAAEVEVGDVDSGPPLPVEDDEDVPAQHRIFADMQKVPAGCTGAVVRNMLLKQLRNTGAESWLNTETHTNGDPIHFNDGSADGFYFNLKVIIIATDNGGDQEASHHDVEADTIDDLCTWYIREWCGRHQLHLMKGKQLKRSPYHYTFLAMLANILRASGNRKKVFDALADKFGIERAKQIMRRLMPRPLKGKWGYTTGSEDWVLSCSAEELVHGFDKGIYEPKACSTLLLGNDYCFFSIAKFSLHLMQIVSK